MKWRTSPVPTQFERLRLLGLFLRARSWNGTRTFVAPLLAISLGLALLPLGLVAQAEKKDAFNRVSDKLICQCGCHYGLSHCPHLNCPSAPSLRAAIREKLAAGLSEEQVLKTLVAEFGPALLAAPPAEGFNLAAWVMPFVALGLGLWAAVTVARRWLARPPAATADAAIVDHYRSQTEREIKRLEE